MNEYNECQVVYRQKCKERIQRQLAIAGRATTDEELEDMIESGNPQIFNQGVRNIICHRETSAIITLIHN